MAQFRWNSRPITKAQQRIVISSTQPDFEGYIQDEPVLGRPITSEAIHDTLLNWFTGIGEKPCIN